MKTLKNLLWISTMLMCITSCSKEEMLEKNTEIPEGKISVTTEVTVDGVVQTDTRAASEAGYTTGDGLYDGGDPVTVAAFANEGYELVKFYGKSGLAEYQGKLSYTFPASVPQVFKAEFAKKYTIDVSASPVDGGTVTGGGAYGNGKTCTLTATANTGYVFSGWYEGSTKLSPSTSYSFTVSSNRTITAKFEKINAGKCFINAFLVEDVTGWELYKPSIIKFAVDTDKTILTGVLRASWLNESLHWYDRKKSFKTTIELTPGTYTYKHLNIEIMSYEGQNTSFNCYRERGEWIGAPCSISISGSGVYPSAESFTLTSGTSYDMNIIF